MLMLCTLKKYNSVWEYWPHDLVLINRFFYKYINDHRNLLSPDCNYLNEWKNNRMNKFINERLCNFWNFIFFHNSQQHTATDKLWQTKQDYDYYYFFFLMTKLNGLYLSLAALHFHQYSVIQHDRAQVSPEQCHRCSEQQQLTASCDIWSSSQQCPLTAMCPKYREYAEYGHARDWWVASERLQSSKKNVGGAVGALPPAHWSAFEVSRC